LAKNRNAEIVVERSRLCWNWFEHEERKCKLRLSFAALGAGFVNLIDLAGQILFTPQKFMTLGTIHSQPNSRRLDAKSRHFNGLRFAKFNTKA
jgi:hypothetical protein